MGTFSKLELYKLYIHQDRNFSQTNRDHDFNPSTVSTIRNDHL